MDIRDYRPDPDSMPFDFGGTVMEKCLCGCTLWWAVVVFHEGEIGGYFLETICYECGSRAKAPTPIDKD
jgi:hypothetical protein